jgi:hypothetical protein
MATISNTPRPGYVWDSTDNCWYPIGTGPHTHSDYITQSTAINPTIVDAKGDIIAASAADTVARLAVGANDTVLTADSSTATGLKWATPAAGGMTLISTTTLSGSSVTLSSIPQTYNSLFLMISGITMSANSALRLAPNNVSNLCNFTGTQDNSGEAVSLVGTHNEYMNLSGANEMLRTNADNAFLVSFNNYTSTTSFKPFSYNGCWGDSSSRNWVNNISGVFRSNSAITSLVLDLGGSTFSTGTVLLYGVK